tara:strand:+ start:51 stop:449 length:399 start_codon:yes stop_codon:yes gene_type:complete
MTESTESTAIQPDVEIYAKRVGISDIIEWLRLYFSIDEQKTVNSTLKLKLTRDGSAMICSIAENVAKGGYTSIWFDSSSTPWQTDEECAQEAYNHFQVEIRCSVSGWTSESEDSGGWYRFTERGKTVVNWLT